MTGTVATGGLLPGGLGERFPDATLLGEGAFGRVLRAHDTRRGRVVAIKPLKDLGPAASGWRARFLREAAVSSRLSSPHVVRGYEAGEEGGVPYLVMEYVPGCDLETLVREAGGHLSLRRSLGIFQQVLDGLVAIHGQGALHRDLKPENVLMRDRHEAVLSDLGLVQDLSQETLTSTGTIMGTMLYMAPELLEGQAASPASDLYAAVLLFWFTCRGRVPGEGETLGEIYRNRAALVPPRLQDLVPGVPASLDALLARALDPDPSRRPRSVWEFNQQLGEQIRLLPRELVDLGGPPSGIHPLPGGRGAPGALPGVDPTALTAEWPAAEAPAARPGETPGSRRWLLFLLVLGVSFGIGGTRLLPGRGPAPAPGPAPVFPPPDPAALQGLFRLERFLAENEKIHDCMELDRDRVREDSRAALVAALQAFEEAEGNYREELSRLDLRGAGPEVADAVGRIARIRWLLQVSARYLEKRDQVPGLRGPWGKLLGELIQVEGVEGRMVPREGQGDLFRPDSPELAARLSPPLWEQRGAERRAEAGRLGLFDRAEAAGLAPELCLSRDQLLASTLSVRRNAANPVRRRYRYPGKGDFRFEFVVMNAPIKADPTSWEAFWPEVEFEVPGELPPEGLDLLLVVDAWPDSYIGSLEIASLPGEYDRDHRGDPEPRRLVLPFQAAKVYGEEKRGKRKARKREAREYWMATRIRVPRRYLPAPLGRIRLRVVGVEPLSMVVGRLYLRNFHVFRDPPGPAPGAVPGVGPGGDPPDSPGGGE